MAGGRGLREGGDEDRAAVDVEVREGLATVEEGRRRGHYIGGEDRGRLQEAKVRDGMVDVVEQRSLGVNTYSEWVGGGGGGLRRKD